LQLRLRRAQAHDDAIEYVLTKRHGSL
jgi:hypothetical protein